MKIALWIILFLAIAAVAECAVYNVACYAGVNWKCYGKNL